MRRDNFPVLYTGLSSCGREHFGSAIIRRTADSERNCFQYGSPVIMWYISMPSIHMSPAVLRPTFSSFSVSISVAICTPRLCHCTVATCSTMVRFVPAQRARNTTELPTGSQNNQRALDKTAAAECTCSLVVWNPLLTAPETPQGRTKLVSVKFHTSGGHWRPFIVSLENLLFGLDALPNSRSVHPSVSPMRTYTTFSNVTSRKYHPR